MLKTEKDGPSKAPAASAGCLVRNKKKGKGVCFYGSIIGEGAINS
jgi:hypothetical protein